MSNNVDNRVVRMTFDNAQFEKKIKNTMQTLTEFENKLKFSNAAKGFDSIKSAADKLNFSALGKNADDASKKIASLASDAKTSLDKMQQQLDKADFSGMGTSADKAADQINKALASINFDDLDRNAQIALSSITDEAGKVDLSSITDAAGRVDFSALPDNVAIALGTVMDLAGDVNFDGIAQNAESVMGDVNSAIDKVDFTSLGTEANDAISRVNNAAGQADFSSIGDSAWSASNDTNNALSSINLYSLVTATDEAGRGFQTMEAIAVGALMNIGAQVESLAANLAMGGLRKIKDAIFNPIQDGLGEYQTQIGSIQTILANTGRDFHSNADIAEVNSVLDDLNLYADKTIYNFTEMVRNIGMFTAAGTDMYDAADAIKGMANLAALQGADSVSASRAMYQMSQALASGTVKLMDWRSLENAGMGGAIFRNVVLDAAEKKYLQEGNTSNVERIQSIRNGTTAFNETLTKNPWLTSDVLLESLTQLTYAFGDLDDSTIVLTKDERAALQQKKETAEAHLKEIGYTKDEIEAIFELGQKAQESATKVRTFKQLMDTISEALGSGWAQSWRYILGDFKQTTDLMTKISTNLTKVIETYDKARNNMLASWVNWGGWQELWGGERTIYQEDSEGNIILDKNGEPVVLDSYNVVGALDHIIEAISKPLQAFKDAFSNVFGDFFTGEHLYELTAAFNDFTKSLILSEGATKGLQGVFEAVFEVIKVVVQVGTHALTIAGDILAIVREIVDPIFDIVLSIFGLTGKSFAETLDFLSKIENGIFGFIHGGLTTLKDIIHTIVGGFFDMLNIPETIGFIGDAIGAFFGKIENGVHIGDLIEDTAESIGIFIINVLDFLGMVPKDIDSTLPLPEIFKKIYDGAKNHLSEAMNHIIDSIPGLRDFVNVMGGSDNQKKIDYFISLFNQIKEKVLPVVTVLAAPLIVLKDALIGLFNAFLNTEPVQNFISWLDGIRNGVIDWIINLPDKITQTAINVGQAFDLLLGNVKSEEVTDEARNMVAGIGDINVTTPFTLLGGGIALGLKNLIETLRGGLGSINEFLFGWLNDRPKEFIKNVEEFIDSLPSAMISIEGPLKEFAKAILPNDMSADIDDWFLHTRGSLSSGLARISQWIKETTQGSRTVPDALIAIITGAWDELLKAIQNFNPEEAATNILTKLDEIKTGVLKGAGNFLDYIFGFKKEKVAGAKGWELEGFTFTEYFAGIGENISKGIEEAKKKVNELFNNNENGTIFDEISKFFIGDDKEQQSLEQQIGTLSGNLNTQTATMVGGIVSTATNPETTFTKISGFIDAHKDDIYGPLQAIATWLDNTFFPNTKNVFSTGLKTVKEAITGGIEEIHKFLEPIFKDVESWPEFFSTTLDNVAKSIGSGIGSVIAYFKDPDFSLTKMFDDIKTSVTNFIETVREKFPALGDILGGVALVLEPIFSVISGFFTGFETSATGAHETVTSAFADIPGTLQTIWDGIVSTFSGAWDSFLTGLDEKVPGTKGVIEQVLTDINDIFNIFDGRVEESSQGILGSITNFFNGLIPIANNSEGKNAIEVINEVLTTLWDSLNENKLSVIAQSIKNIGEGIILVNLGRFIGGLKGIVDSVSDKISGIERKSFTEKIKDIAEAIAIVVASIWAISTIPEDDLKRSENCIKMIAVILAAMEGLELATSAVAKIFKLKEFNSAKESALEIAALAIAMKVIGDMDLLTILKAGAVIAAMKGVLTAIDTIGTMVSGWALGKAGVNKFAPVKSSVGEILALAFSMLVLSLIPEDALKKAGTAITVMSIVLLSFQEITGQIAKTNPLSLQSVDMLSTAIIRMAASAAIVCWGLSKLGDSNPLTTGLAATMITAMTGIFAYVATHITPVQAAQLDSVSKSLALAAASIVGICLGFKELDGVDPGIVLVAGLMIDSFLGIMYAIAKAASDIKTAGPMLSAGGMVSLSALGVVAICLSLKELASANIDPAKLGWATAAVEVLVATIGLLGKSAASAATVGPLLASGGAMLLASGGVVAICLGLKELASANITKDSFQWAVGAIEVLVITIGLINGISGSVAQWAPMLASGGAFAIAALGIIEICIGLKQLDGMNPDTLSGAAATIDQFLLIIGGFNTLNGILGSTNSLSSAINMLASGGSFALAALGIIEICNGLKQLDGMNPDTLSGAAATIDQFLLIIGSFNTLSGVVGAVNPLAFLSMLASGGAFWLASMGIIEICQALKSLDGMSTVNLEPATNAISDILEVIGKANAMSGFTVNALGTLASGGAFWTASMGIIDICNGLKTIQGMSEQDIEIASNAIEKLIGIVSKVNSSHNIFDSAITLLVGGGAFFTSAHGIVDICVALKELQDIKEIDLSVSSKALDDFIVIVKRITPEITPIATVSNIVKEDGSLTIATKGIVSICQELRAMNDIGTIDFGTSIDAVNNTVEIIRIINKATSTFGTIFASIGKDGAFYGAAIGVVDICKAIKNIESVDASTIEGTAKSVDEFTKILESISKFLSSPIFSKGEVSLSFISESVSSLATSLTQMADAVRSWMELSVDLPSLLKGAQDSLEQIRTNIDTKTKEFPNKVSDWWLKTAVPAIDDLVGKIETKYDECWGKISKKITKSWDEWWKEAKKWWNDIPDKVIEAVGDTTKIGSSIIDGIVEGIEDAMNGRSFNTALSNIGTTIYNKITKDLDINSPSKLMRDNVGKAIPEGIGVGMVRYSKLMNKPINKMGDQTLGYITKYFGIHSPSRLMRDKVGKYIPAGIAAGMDEYAVIAVDSAEELGSSVSQAVYSGLGDISGSKYGYGISPVIDMETLKTDIEVIHEMLRAKIDDIFGQYREFITEQIQSRFDNETLRYDQIVQHLNESDIALYNQLIQYLNEHLITTFDDYLNGMINYLESALPDMTQQILGAFDTTNQTVAGILQTLSSEQRQSVDTVITDTIVQEIGKLSQGMDSVAQEVSSISTKFEQSNLVVTANYEALQTGLFGSSRQTKSELTIADMLEEISGHAYDADWYDMSLGNVAGGIYHAIAGDDVKSQSSLFNRMDLLQEYLTSIFGEANGNSDNIIGALDSGNKTQEELAQYLNTALGGTTGSSSASAIDLLSHVQDGQLDLNGLFSEAVEKFKSIDGNLDDVKKTQTTLSDVIDRINSNTKDMSNMDVYLDSGELVGALAPAIDSSLGWAADVLDRTGLVPGGSSAAAAIRSFGSTK